MDCPAQVQVWNPSQAQTDKSSENQITTKRVLDFNSSDCLASHHFHKCRCSSASARVCLGGHYLPWHAAHAAVGCME